MSFRLKMEAVTFMVELVMRITKVYSKGVVSDFSSLKAGRSTTGGAIGGAHPYMFNCGAFSKKGELMWWCPFLSR